MKNPRQLGLEERHRRGQCLMRETATATGPNLSEVERDGTPAYHTEYRAVRVVTLLDKLWRDRAISYGRYRAGKEYARLHEQVEQHSEGVSSYGDASRADPTAKADRMGRRYTGKKIEPDGSITHGRRPNWTREYVLEEARFAAFGVHDREGDKHWLPVLRVVLFRVCCDTENPPTQTEITLLITNYYKETSKQAASASVPLIDMLLGRLELHFGFAK